ncbi:hypothetical protein HDU86_001956 [Geranomyces michiganensis]|nr:hypothetical protein HDU86_001956 [Geranomyces michiganensis]
MTTFYSARPKPRQAERTPLLGRDESEDQVDAAANEPATATSPIARDGDEALSIRSSPGDLETAGPAGRDALNRTAATFRLLALACAVLLAFGSHFAGVSFGTLKTAMRKELNLTNTQYAVALASNDLMGTFVPLLAGMLYDVYGTGIGSLLTTGTIFMGTVLVASAAEKSSYALLVLGRVVYGLGAGSVNVVQQTIIARWFAGQHMAPAMSALLLVNRLGTVIGNSSVIPLMESADHWSWSLWVTAMVAGASVVVNLGYLVLLHLSTRAGRELVIDAKQPASTAATHKHAFQPKSILYFSHTFWLIAIIHFLSVGVMNSFLGFSTDLIQQRFKGSTAEAAYKTTISLAVPLLLYSVLGPVFERVGHRVTAIFLSGAILTVFCFFIGFTSISPIFSMVLLAISIALKGLASLTAIPLVVPTSHVGTAFAIYRCIMSISTSLLDLMVGKLQDNTPGEKYDRVMGVFVALSATAMMLALAWIFVDRRHYGGAMQWNDQRRAPFLEARRREEKAAADAGFDVLVDGAARKAGIAYAAMFFASVGLAWATFLWFIIPALRDEAAGHR